MTVADAETLLRNAKYFFADKPHLTELGCHVETCYSATGQNEGKFVGLVERVTLSTKETS